MVIDDGPVIFMGDASWVNEVFYKLKSEGVASNNVCAAVASPLPRTQLGQGERLDTAGFKGLPAEFVNYSPLIPYRAQEERVVHMKESYKHIARL